MMSTSGMWTSIFLIIFCLNTVESGKLLSSGKLALGNALVRKFAMFSREDAPAKTWPGNGASFIDINYQIGDVGTSRVWAVTLQSEYKKNFNFNLDGKHIFCCETSNAIDSKAYCPNTQDIGIPALYAQPQPGQMFFVDEAKDGRLQATHNVTATGMFYSFIFVCKVNDESKDASLSGYLYYMNPYGNLSGDMWYLMPFFLSILLVYFLIFIYWIVVSLIHRKELLKLQNWIALIVLCGVIENASIYFAYLGYNNIGENYIGAMIVGTIVSSLKKTLSRVLILVVCMGYGVVKPTLGTTAYRVACLGFMYFVFSCASFVADLVYKSGTIMISDALSLILVLPTAILNTWFYWWTLTSLMRTITLLQERRQTIKLQMYKSFFLTLIGLGCALIIIVFSQTIVMLATEEDNTWKVSWIWEAFLEILYLVVLLTIVIIWRPIKNNTRYAYSEMDSSSETTDVEADVQQVVLSTFGGGLQVRNNKGTQEDQAQRKQAEDDSKASFTIDEE